MANTKQARKRIRQDEKRRLRNRSTRSTYRTHIKRFLSEVESGDRNAAEKTLVTVESLVDRAAKRNIIHGGKASRIKARLKARLAKAGSEA